MAFGVGFLLEAAFFIVKPLLQTNLFPFLIQVKILSWATVFLLRVLQVEPCATLGAAFEICGISDTTNVAANERVNIFDAREIFIWRLCLDRWRLYRLFPGKTTPSILNLS